LTLPGDINRLVQAVYGDDSLLEDLDAEAFAYITQEAYGKRLAHEKDERQKAFNIAVDANAEPQLAYLPLPRGSEEGEALGLVNKTRLGDEAVTVVPVYTVDGGWRVTPEGEDFDPQQPVTDRLACRLYGRQLKINRKGLVAYFGGVTAPSSFTEHPLLRHLKPMQLSADGHMTVDGLRVQLDQELGLTYGANTFKEENA
jgi:CRISPR-associated endonuclease/helicase Cas3